ncbi:hypothetical protein CEXT_780281 [Caerostris extrusa]|uniref:Uncharacterized protein n=1 Tax=Caerostris extrusa TaxID=172846 RepID=A0AAV4S8D1_CAEEX|nr:hypothetical protein CEXT_780281 [Caerostris extrusa]
MSRLRSNPRNKRIKQIPAESVVNKFRDPRSTEGIRNLSNQSSRSTPRPTQKQRKSTTLTYQDRMPPPLQLAAHEKPSMFILAVLSCIVVAQASLLPVLQPHHAPSYEIRHAVRDHLGERVRGSLSDMMDCVPTIWTWTEQIWTWIWLQWPLFSTDTGTEMLWATVVFLEMLSIIWSSSC